ncbi:hypothetical protein VNO78_19134 [Psophocarpus tetragonolobus]|uniref:Uncharacterized protein n=1 Tax=Psophocarpus tetragonolobus TaxID=3891 RepID=A0AAN9S7A4_PSOTE
MQTRCVGSRVLSGNLLWGLSGSGRCTTGKRLIMHASKREYDGKLVDENMIVLRMRIREIEMLQMKGKAPSHWSEWENKYFGNYDSDVCQALGFLQTILMNVRPSFALAMLALLILCVSFSTFQLLFSLLHFAT